MLTTFNTLKRVKEQSALGNEKNRVKYKEKDKRKASQTLLQPIFLMQNAFTAGVCASTALLRYRCVKNDFVCFLI